MAGIAPLITTDDIDRVERAVAVAERDDAALTAAVAEFNQSLDRALAALKTTVTAQAAQTQSDLNGVLAASVDQINTLLSNAAGWEAQFENLETQAVLAQNAHFQHNFGEVHGVGIVTAPYIIDGTRHGAEGSNGTVTIGVVAIAIPTSSGVYYAPASLSPWGTPA